MTRLHPPASVFVPPATRHQQLVDAITQKITASVDPASWKPNGIASVVEINGHLLVAQTPANQNTIRDLLQKESARAGQVAIETRFLLVSDATLKAITLPAPQPITWPGNPATNAPAKTLSTSLLEEQQLQTLRQITDRAPDTSTLRAPRVTLFDGLGGLLSQTAMQNYIVSVQPGSNDQNGKPGVNLNIQTLFTGTLVHLQSTLAPDHQSVTLNIHPSLKILDRIDTIQVPELGQNAFYHKPVTHGTEFAIQSTIPNGKTLVVTAGRFTGNFPDQGSFTQAPWQCSPPIANAPDRNLLLLVRPQIIPTQPE